MKVANIPYILLILAFILMGIGVWKKVSVMNELKKIKDGGGSINQSQEKMFKDQSDSGDTLVVIGFVVIIINAITYNQWE